ncbi:DUF429 domain-containing protein [Streptomyces paradoxus]|uniref:DUF429 domain-containing protein n=1 Tax=Streptomyces paradoxus TaxID=66375 RepID=UPI0036FEF8C7
MSASPTRPTCARRGRSLAPKLLEARACRLADERIHEVHPEVSFRALADGVPLPYATKTWRGQNARRHLLAAAGLTLPDELGEADGIPVDDVLDAAAAAWSAHRIALGVAGRIPEVPEVMWRTGTDAPSIRSEAVALWFDSESAEVGPRAVHTG